MKIKMLTSMSGPSTQRSRGEEVDVDDAEAIRLIESGFAEPVRGSEPEMAVKKRRSEKASTATTADEVADPASDESEG